jgi:hypothetical protein
MRLAEVGNDEVRVRTGAEDRSRLFRDRLARSP